MPDHDGSRSRSSSNSNENNDNSAAKIHYSDSGFPLFPPDFKPDTLYLHQALAEHNYERIGEGLSAQNYFQLSDEERHEVLARAGRIKSAARSPEVIRLSSPAKPFPSAKSLDIAEELSASLGLYLLVFGAICLTALLWKIL